MTKRERLNVDRKKEMRTKEISKMIGEGGLGADNYYNIKKEDASSKIMPDKDNKEK